MDLASPRLASSPCIRAFLFRFSCIPSSTASWWNFILNNGRGVHPRGVDAPFVHSPTDAERGIWFNLANQRPFMNPVTSN